MAKGEFTQDNMLPCHSPIRQIRFLYVGAGSLHALSRSRPHLLCTMALSNQTRKRTTAGTDTNLTSAEADHQVSNEGIFCFSRAVTHHHAPAIGLGKLAAGRKTGKASHHPICIATFALMLLPSARYSLLWQDRTALWYVRARIT